MDITEVPGMFWKAFLDDMKELYGENSDEYRSNLPDFSKWQAMFPEMTTAEISDKFIQEEVFNLIPVVGVSYDQVIAFCQWRVRKLQKELDEMDPKMRANFPKKFTFRLPTNKEWARIRFMRQDKRTNRQLDKLVANNLKFFKMKKNSVVQNANLVTHIYNSKNEVTGLYNLFDNVAEMTSERGLAMGGSWEDANEASVWTKEISYEGAQPWLGFRCIFEVIK